MEEEVDPCSTPAGIAVGGKIAGPGGIQTTTAHETDGGMGGGIREEGGAVTVEIGVGEGETTDARTMVLEVGGVGGTELGGGEGGGLNGIL